MSHRLPLVLLASAAVLAASPALAQSKPSPWSVGKAVDAPDNLTLSGSMRIRYEAIDGQARPGFNEHDDLISLRTILGAEYRAGPVRLVGELHDSRVWEDDAGSPVTTSEVNTFELVQAYIAADFDSPFAKGKASVQAGRFTLNLGSRRLVAADDYRNTTNGYTGVRFDAALPAGMKGSAVWVMPHVRLPDDRASVRDSQTEWDQENDDLVIWGGVLSRPDTFGKAMLEGSYFHFEEKDAPGRPTRDRSLDSVSLRVVRDPAAGKLDYEVEVIAQTGEISAGLGPAAATLDVEAGFAHAEVGYSFSTAWKPRLSAEVDYASGDDSDASYGRFDTLFGMRRADFAPSGIYNAVGRSNIVSPGVRLEMTQSPRLDSFLAVRALWLASATDSFSTTGVRDAAGDSGRFAGYQLDGRVRYWLVPDALRLEVNGVWLAKGRFLETAPNAPDSRDTLYMSLNLSAFF
ncbi:alginate export family protein [Caulobacter sp. SLTY]|uniref:alginate export family protein n=1 Tax=Caulobacter sp. SLTY TaxID=2683262 RepID=UPI00196A35DC|nr:alginate export family protein [Caulobacter sp. SLTY]